MKGVFTLSLYIFISLFFTSCIVHAPKYTGIEEVMQLKVGMTREEVSKTLGIPAYDLKAVTDSGVVYIYKYRTTDRKILPLAMNKTNGIKAKGKWIDLFVTYDRDGKATSFNSCSECESTEVKKKKIDINTVIVIVTVIIPSVMVYLGLRASP